MDIYHNSESGYFAEADVEKMLRKNPQIRSLHLLGSIQSFLDTINELLPDLEHLELQSLRKSSNNSNVINFKNVKTLNYYSDYSGSLNIYFEKLNELHTDAYHGSDSVGVEFSKQINHF